WWLITSAPLLAAATLCLACTAYLRMLFREVRGLDHEDRLADRLQKWKASLFAATAAEPSADAQPAKSAEKPKPPRTSKTAKPAAGVGQPDTSDDAGTDAADPATAKPRLKQRLTGMVNIGRHFKRPKRAD